MSVTFPCASNVNRKRPVPDCPGRDWPGGNDGAGAKSNRGFGVACGVGLVSGHLRPACLSIGLNSRQDRVQRSDRTSNGFFSSRRDDANNIAILIYDRRPNRTCGSCPRNFQSIGRMRSDGCFASAPLVSSQRAADHCDLCACRELAGFGQVKKPQKLLGLDVGLEHRQIRRLRNGENSVHIVNSAVRRLRDSVNAAFNCMCTW